MACSAASCGRFSTFSHAANLGDADWHATMFNGLCFKPASSVRQSRWVLPYTPAQQNASHDRNSAFQRFPLTFVASSKWAPDANVKTEDGVTYIADLRHAGTGPPGIAHFAKRLLRLHGMQLHAKEYGLPPVARIVFPATTAIQLRTHWPKALLQLVAPNASLMPAEELLREMRCFKHVVVASRENTYFTRFEDAEALRQRAYALARIPLQRPPCAPLRTCYFQRATGGRANSGSWEGGPRMVANWQHVVELMGRLVGTIAPGGTVELVRVNSSMTLAQQVERTWHVIL